MFSFHGLTKGQWDTFDLLKRSDTHYPSLQFLAQLLTQVVLLAMALLDSAFRLMVHQYRILAINSSSERQKNYISCIVCIVVTWHKVSSNQDTYIDTSLDTSLNRRVYSRSAYRLQRLVPQLFMLVNFSLLCDFCDVLWTQLSPGDLCNLRRDYREQSWFV